ncbi:hypothetical protein RIF29_13632 [Crotalaria pallida]|uniref:Uncharacterized protein n=1 Tax=Crotalaria pallida TaxID=3830 RepID=A0AAN9IPX0_CROPI
MEEKEKVNLEEDVGKKEKKVCTEVNAEKIDKPKSLKWLLEVSGHVFPLISFNHVILQGATVTINIKCKV